METTISIRGAIRQGHWACLIDLKDAYFNILIHRVYWKFLMFSWRDKVFQFVCLRFGLAHLPYIFTKVVREVPIILRRQSIRIHCYLDDWLIPAQDNPGLQGILVSGLLDGFSWFRYQPGEEQSVTDPIIRIPGDVV